LAWYGNPISPEQAAASRAAEYQATMDDWGVTALRTWVAVGRFVEGQLRGDQLEH